MSVRISAELIPPRVGSGSPQNGSLCNFVLHNFRKLVEIRQFSLGRTIFMIILREHLPAFLRWALASLLCACAVFLMFYAHMEAYLLTPRCRVLLEKLTGLQLVKKFPAFYGTRRFIPHSQVPATCPYPEPAWSSPHPYILLPEDPS